MSKRTVEHEQGGQSHLMSQRALNKLKNDLPVVKAEYERASRVIGETGEGSDWHDNFAFEQAHRDFEVARERYFGVLQKLDNPVIIEPRRKAEDVEVGNTVRVQFSDEDFADILHILGTVDATLFQDSISSDSPLGSNLLGKRKGDSITYEVERARVTVKIVDVLPGEF